MSWKKFKSKYLKPVVQFATSPKGKLLTSAAGSLIGIPPQTTYSALNAYGMFQGQAPTQMPPGFGSQPPYNAATMRPDGFNYNAMRSPQVQPGGGAQMSREQFLWGNAYVR